MCEKFEKVCNFYHHPESNEWQPKECMFKIVSINCHSKDICSVLAEKKFDMTNCIGADGVFQLDMDNGFFIDIVMKIAEPYIPPIDEDEVELTLSES